MDIESKLLLVQDVNITLRNVYCTCLYLTIQSSINNYTYVNKHLLVPNNQICNIQYVLCFLQGNRFSMSRDQQSLSTGHVGFPITATKISEKTHHCTQVHINLTRYVMHMWTGLTNQSGTSLQYTTKLHFFTKFFKNNTNCTIKNENNKQKSYSNITSAIYFHKIVQITIHIFFFFFQKF